MSTAVGTTPLCGHCGRPVIGQPGVYCNGVMYHMACTRSPYEQLIEGMEPLGADFEKVWDDNVSDLYEH